MSNVREIDQELFETCTSASVDILRVEQLLKSGANPLGHIEFESDSDNLYNAVLSHYIDVALDGCDDSVFLKITELFLKYGMKIDEPELPYDNENILNPLWSFSFYSTETAMQALMLLLDNGLDVDSAGQCWSHELTDLGFADFVVCDDTAYRLATETFKKVMLIASYSHIIDNDEFLRKEIWYDKNDYDITKFRNWNGYDYVIEPTRDKYVNRSLVRIIEKRTKEEVWKFGFEISFEEASI